MPLGVEAMRERRDLVDRGEADARQPRRSPRQQPGPLLDGGGQQLLPLGATTVADLLRPGLGVGEDPRRLERTLRYDRACFGVGRRPPLGGDRVRLAARLLEDQRRFLRASFLASLRIWALSRWASARNSAHSASAAVRAWSRISVAAASAAANSMRAVERALRNTATALRRRRFADFLLLDGVEVRCF